MRMTRQAVGDLTLVNDAYNANPDAVLAALRAFGEVAADAPRRVSVLGDMLELGDGAPAMHAEVGRAAAASGVGLAVFVGELSAHGAAAARAAGGCEVLHVAALDDPGVAAIAGALRARDAVLLKGSRGSRMERLASALAQRTEGAVAGAR
jgi:UDP-N-acetylmuramoyl-tripeptide--D-alanyl-D-alanine ligase